MFFVYMLVGILYALYNGFVKKLDTDGDWDIGLIWMLLWPMFFVAILIDRTQRLFKSKNI